MILDGATGTALMKAGMPRGCCTEKWVSENPDVLINIQKKYVASGSDAVYAPTFGANRAVLHRHGFKTDVKALNSSLLGLAKKSGAAVCAADLSPTGCFIEPLGETPFEEVVDIYAEQAAALKNADYYAVETSISLNEVRAAVLGIRSVSDKPIFVTLTVEASGMTMSGDSLLAALLTLAPMGISAFGANCSTGPAEMLEVLKPLLPYSVALGIPLIAKPNAGMPHQLPDGSTEFDLCAADFESMPLSFSKAELR